MSTLKNQGIVTVLTLVCTPVYLSFASNFDGSPFFIIPIALVVNSFTVHFMNSINSKDATLLSIIHPLVFAFSLFILNFIPEEEFSPHYSTHTLWYPYALLSFLMIFLASGVLKITLLIRSTRDSSEIEQTESDIGFSKEPSPTLLLIDEKVDFILVSFNINKKINIFNESNSRINTEDYQFLLNTIQLINKTISLYNQITSEEKKQSARNEILDMLKLVSDKLDSVASFKDEKIVSKIKEIKQFV